jgi:thiamine biosynthesis lipoprotein
MIRAEQIMGTAISVEIVDGDPALFGDVFAWFREVDERFSTFKDGSEVNRLDRGEITADDCSDDMRFVLSETARLWSETEGYFDVYATGRLDPSGFVKGWSVQVASDRLLAAGAGDHCLNAGGDVRVRGHAESGKPWRIGIQHPFEKMKVAWVLEGTDLAVATSGTYERGFHVVDPFSRGPVEALCAVTVTAAGPVADLGRADALATAAIAMGRKGISWLAGLSGYESAVVTCDGEAFRSERLQVA